MKTFLKVIFAALLMYLTSLLFPKGELTFIIWSIVLFAFYLFVLYVLKEIKKEDLGIIRTLISRKKKEEVKQELSGNEPEV